MADIISGTGDSSESASLDGVDVTVPSIARVYDALLGGKDNFAVDRAVAAELLAAAPGSETTGFSHRAMLARGVKFLVEQGITQFIDLGSGLPTAQNTHQVAQAIAPQTRVVYVDNDPIVLAHGRALLAENEYTTVVTADMREPDSVLDNPELKRLIRNDEPIGLMLLGVIHHLNDDEEPAALLKRYLDVLPSGSWLFLTHFLSVGAESDALERIMQGAHKTGRFRTREEIEGFFTGLELADPGVVLVDLWRPDTPVDIERLSLGQRLVLGGIARKP